MADLVILKGERLAMKASEALADMGPGDVYVKGVNAVNYERKQAAVLIGHTTGGGVGAAIGTVVARRIVYLHDGWIRRDEATAPVVVEAQEPALEAGR